MLRAAKYEITPVSCTKQCPPKRCGDITVEEIDELIYKINHKLSEYSEQYLYNVQYFEACNPDAEEDFKKLSLYLPTLERYKQQLTMGVEHCLSSPTVGHSLERVQDLTGNCNIETRKDLIVDTTNYDTWVLNNPRCVPYEEWESILYIRCEPLTFEVEALQQICSYNIECDLSFDYNGFIQVVKECELLLDVNIQNYDQKDCVIEFGILQEKIQDCTITFDEYTELRNCGIDYKVIQYLQNCGVEIRYNIETRCPEITYHSLIVPVCSWSNISDNVH